MHGMKILVERLNLPSLFKVMLGNDLFVHYSSSDLMLLSFVFGQDSAPLKQLLPQILQTYGKDEQVHNYKPIYSKTLYKVLMISLQILHLKLEVMAQM